MSGEKRERERGERGKGKGEGEEGEGGEGEPVVTNLHTAELSKHVLIQQLIVVNNHRIHVSVVAVNGAQLGTTYKNMKNKIKLQTEESVKRREREGYFCSSTRQYQKSCHKISKPPC